MKYKVPVNIVNASEALFLTLIKNLGGSTEVGKKVGLVRQGIHNFEKEGYVPLKQVYSIAKQLNLKPWHLSYYKLMEVFGAETPAFDILVKRLNILTDEDKDKILKIYKRK